MIIRLILYWKYYIFERKCADYRALFIDTSLVLVAYKLQTHLIMHEYIGSAFATYHIFEIIESFDWILPWIFNMILCYLFALCCQRRRGARLLLIWNSNVEGKLVELGQHSDFSYTLLYIFMNITGAYTHINDTTVKPVYKDRSRETR